MTKPLKLDRLSTGGARHKVDVMAVTIPASRVILHVKVEPSPVIGNDDPVIATAVTALTPEQARELFNWLGVYLHTQ